MIQKFMIQKYYYLLNFLATMNNFSTPIWRALSIMAIAGVILDRVVSHNLAIVVEGYDEYH